MAVVPAPLPARALTLTALGLALFAGAVSAQTGSVTGRVEDATRGTPVADALVVLDGTRFAVATDAEGRFAFPDVPAGRYTLRVRHIAYGERAIVLPIAAGPTPPVRVLLSDTAITLDSIEVRALSAEERQIRGAGYRRGVVLRDQIAEAETTNMTLGEVLRSYVPGVRVRFASNLAGAPMCIELRSIRATQQNECLSPAVYLDGVPINNPSLLFNTLALRMIESMEVVPAAEAGARFGTGALYGALLIETRRPGAATAEGRAVRVQSGTWDWEAEGSGHPSARAFLYGFVGSAAGLALGLTAANQCIGTRQPANDRIIAKCDTGPTLASAGAALVLPAFGGALGSGLGGKTGGSKGKIWPAAIGGAMALMPAYGLIFSGRRMDSEVLLSVGASLLVIGVPAVATLADHQFRTGR